MEKEILLKKTMANLEKLPADRIKEVSDFIEFLLTKFEDQLITEGIQNLTSESKAFEFLENEPDLYSVNDLKIRYK